LRLNQQACIWWESVDYSDCGNSNTYEMVGDYWWMHWLTIIGVDALVDDY